MPHTAYPTAAQINAYLLALGLFEADDLAALTDAVDLASIAEAVQAAWEADTGWKPFLRDSSDVSRRIDPPGPNRRGLSRGAEQRLELESGLLAVTSFVSGYSATDGGSALTLEEDYYLYPANAGLDMRPWTAIDFPGYQWGLPQSLRITGRWGYAAQIPADAWQAMLRQGALLLISELSLNATGGVEAWTWADRQERFDTKAWEGYAERWQSQWRQAVRRYARAYL